jgi:glycosyltransferase involved in cell wall biosynthesis
LEFPQVLVVMPLYNARPYVQAAIESVFAQTYPNFTLLVINDGSTDGSDQVAAAYQDRGLILWHQENQGPGAAMNRAIQYAHDLGIQFIARVDSDDIALPDRLEKQINLMLKYPQTAACSANCYYIDPQSEKVIGSSTVSTSNALIRWEINHGLRGLIQPVCTHRTEALYTVGGYRTQFKLAEEVDVYLRLAESYELVNSSLFLARIRLNPLSLSMSNVEKNILYQFYALDCANHRRNHKPEREYEAFLHNMSWCTKIRIWREEYLLKLWRAHMGTRHLPSLLLAGLLDPRRVVIRGLRKLDEWKQI